MKSSKVTIHIWLVLGTSIAAGRVFHPIPLYLSLFLYVFYFCPLLLLIFHKSVPNDVLFQYQFMYVPGDLLWISLSSILTRYEDTNEMYGCLT